MAVTFAAKRTLLGTIHFMPQRIEDYAIIGDCETAALVGKDGSIDWLCFPRFDSPACFAALLGTPENGCWKITPVGEVQAIRRRYRDSTLVLETDFETSDGEVRLIDCMPHGAPTQRWCASSRDAAGACRCGWN